jgi:hypothetical protein
VVGTALVVLAIVVALVATGVAQVPSSSGSAASSARRNAPMVRSKTTTNRLPAVRTLSVDAPLKLWIGGDSLAGSLGPSLGAMTAQTGIVAPQFDSRVSTGLNSPEFFDWPTHATQEMARLQPEAVVFIIDTNDANMMPALGASSSSTSTPPQWQVDYAARVEQMMQIFVGDTHRRVYWVGTPPMKAKQLDANVRALDAVIAEVAARHPEVTYVDVNSEFTDDQGGYASSRPGPNGTSVQLRAGDGIHLTPAGGDRMAKVAFDAIDAAWHVKAQAVEGHVHPVLETEGSSQVPGTHRSGSSGGSSSGGSSDTTQATTGTTSVTDPAATTTPTEASTTPSTEPPTTPSSEPSTTPTSAGGSG